MCNRNCKNCKYYEYQRTVDNEVHWCNYPNQEGIISNDEEIVNEFSCKHYERVSDLILSPNKWYYVENDIKHLFIADLYKLYKKTCADKSMRFISLDSFVDKYKVKFEQGNHFRLNSHTCEVNFRSNYNPMYMNEPIKYREVKDMLLKPNKCEGEINMNTNMCGHDTLCGQQGILDLYYQKKSAQYSAETQEAIATIHINSVCGRAAKNYVNYLKKNGVNEKLIPDYRSLINEHMLTPTELKMIDELNDAYHTAMNNLNKKCQECAAILVTCETFEQKMVVLQNYDIIDCLYKLK